MRKCEPTDQTRQKTGARRDLQVNDGSVVIRKSIRIRLGLEILLNFAVQQRDIETLLENSVNY